MSLKQFREVHPRLCEALGKLRFRQRLGQAYLFMGDEAGYVDTFVKAWLQGVICESPSHDGDACGECRACIQFDAGSYPYYQQLFPTSKTRRIVVDSVRDFEHQLTMAKPQDAYRIGIVHEADRMMEEAQNAFLKTLEEPPSGTILALTTTQPDRLLPTIRSRCQLVSLLKNRRQYDLATEMGLFSILARLRVNAGAAVGLKAAFDLTSIFSSLYETARERIEEAEQGVEEEQALAEQDETFEKRMKEVVQARVQAEYLQLREEILDAVSTWFYQQYLIAIGVPAEYIPHPELLEAAGIDHASMAEVDAKEVEYNLRYVNELLSTLATNARESLAIEAFCLSVCRKAQ